MKDIDQELIDWAIDTIKNEYKEDVALLIGQKGGCKIPTDNQNIAFDFFIPATDRGYQLSQTFVIEDMGYDLFPISWERLEGIADLNERITFAFMNGVVLYARTKEEEQRFLDLQQTVRERLKEQSYREKKAMEKVEAVMEIYKSMAFSKNLSEVRKAAGGIMMYLSYALATYNGTYINGRFGKEQYVYEVIGMKEHPEDFEIRCNLVISGTTVQEVQNAVHGLIQSVRDFLLARIEKTTEERNYNYEDLASWYYEARYSFRRFDYYAAQGDTFSSYELGCYLQIEFDELEKEFGLNRMDLLGVFDVHNLKGYKQKAEEIEEYILAVLKEHEVPVKIYPDLKHFLEDQNKNNKE
ncbi:MAG: hypothetical protein Q4G58_01195 [bacterium]|nr:hypothetical protein [bacterium]